MIAYRTFRNIDPPALVDVWNTSFTHPRIVPVRSPTFLEYFLFAKTYFDPAGLIVALEGDKIVGFVHAGFTPREDQAGLESSTGVICTLAVLPSYRRQGIGSQLVLRAEAYLRQRGAVRAWFGSQTPHNPFLFGLHGGCTTIGLVDNDEASLRFLTRHGYDTPRRLLLFRRHLARLPIPMDTRFGAIRANYDILASYLRQAGWWQESVLGPVEAVEYRLEDKLTHGVPARLVLWDMDTFSLHWGQPCIGLIDLQVIPSARRLGLAKYLMLNVLRHLRDRSFAFLEVAVAEDNQAMRLLLSSLEFEPVGQGVSYFKPSLAVSGVDVSAGGESALDGSGLDVSAAAASAVAASTVEVSALSKRN
ncbi:MAG: GNAT family N-acetyltransferase [Gemmataceae bacterium]